MLNKVKALKEETSKFLILVKNPTQIVLVPLEEEIVDLLLLYLLEILVLTLLKIR